MFRYNYFKQHDSEEPTSYSALKLKIKCLDKFVTHNICTRGNIYLINIRLTKSRHSFYGIKFFNTLPEETQSLPFLKKTIKEILL